MFGELPVNIFVDHRTGFIGLDGEINTGRRGKRTGCEQPHTNNQGAQRMREFFHSKASSVYCYAVQLDSGILTHNIIWSYKLTKIYGYKDIRAEMWLSRKPLSG